jgi:hypothetical protein
MRPPQQTQQQNPWRQPQMPQPAAEPFREFPAPQRDVAPMKPRPPAPPQYTVPPPKPQPTKPANDYYDYGSINLEPITKPEPAPQMDDFSTPTQSQAPVSIDKTDLDLEIERYQREIEEKQRRQRMPGQQKPQQNFAPAPQEANYDTFEAVNPTDSEAQSYPPSGQASDQSSQTGDQPLYFTTVDRSRKKGKRPINPKSRPQGGFLSKFFNKDNP